MAAVAGARAPHRVDPDDSDIETVLFAPVSYPTAAVVAAGAASTIGTAATQPELTAVGILAGIVATIVQMCDNPAPQR